MNCGQVRHALGVYIVGAIDPAERAEVDNHLSACAACRDELASLAGLPALLGKVTQDADEQRPERPDVHPGLLDRVLTRVAAERRRSRRLRVAAAAAGVIVVAGLTGGLGASLAGGPGNPVSRPAVSAPPSPSPAVFSATDPGSGVSATVALRPKDWGASLTTRVTDVPRGISCHLVVIGPGGARDVAGSWQVTYQGSASVTGSTAMVPSAIERFQIVTEEGRTLVTIPAM